ncbi:conjugal transfer protein TrbJ [Sulfuriferula plumbiphila]|uniref:Conjugal transfer protein TrbJ n=1 Tax=Sulfuriferula plumbiphila TaxID=171865 RepID=A0A512L7T7_9PROT|nr:P-type conjugative transfer protein TrbJ [Sulfuriferula plumbiphila]BBP04520.1 conjugal transfer protein TrbJ [Sulfuriferula plumbiphila]GEP30546.1 conjugal transfer protein TrbJ [Sulfuriferula plumbiphila]
MKKTLLAVAAAVLMTVMPSVQATVVVIDPANLIQNILTAARTLQQINNQIQQLQNEAQMLTNQARNLTSLPFSALNQLQSALSATNQLLQQAQGLSLNLTQMETQFAQLYPAAYTSSTPANQMALDASQRWQNSLEALRTAAEVQSQSVQNFTSDEQTLSDLVNSSQSAVGALQATQATNQLLALQARQAIQAQQLQITQDRAVALEQARQVAVHARAAEVRNRFHGTGTPYTPYSVNFYGN